MPYGMTAPNINPHTFPYLKKFTTDELNDLLERIEDLRNAMVDMVGPSGVVTYIDAGTIANIAFHLAMAGARIVDDEKAYIWPDVQADQEGIFEGYVTWRLKKEHEPPPAKKKAAPPLDPDAVAEAAARARDQINAQLHPDVKKKLLAELVKEYEVDTTDREDDSR